MRKLIDMMKSFRNRRALKLDPLLDRVLESRPLCLKTNHDQDC